MIKNMKIRRILYNIFIYLFALSIILEANSIYSQIFGYHLKIRASIIAINLICVIGILLFRKNENTKNKFRVNKWIIMLVIYAFVCGGIMSFYANGMAGRGIAVLIFMLIFPLFLILFGYIDNKTFIDILRAFVNIVVILCVISLMFWITGSVNHLINPTSSLKVIWAIPYSYINSYFYIHFDTQTIYWLSETPLVRNTGIFTEGPMYALILVVALIFNNLILNYKEKYFPTRTSILLLTILSTFSVTGLICAVFIILVDLIRMIFSFSKRKKIIIVLSIIVLVTCSLPFTVKLASKKIQTSSASHRNMDIQNGFKAFTEAPLFGYGINHDRDNEKHPVTGYGYSNTVIPVITDGGIMLLIIYLIPAGCSLVAGIRKKSKECIVLTIIYFIIIFTTLIPYRLILMLVISIMINLLLNKKILGGLEHEK